jgi:hypothetical protein
VDLAPALSYNAPLEDSPWRFGARRIHMDRHPRKLTLADKLALGWGKLRRAYLITCRPERVRRSLARRVGACARTGACCQLMVVCCALDRSNDRSTCAIYLDRGPNCSIFPIDERDLADRDRILPDIPCGYRFIPEEEFGRRPAGAPDVTHRFPWEIDGNTPGGTVRRTTAFTVALAYVRTFWTAGKNLSRNGNGRANRTPTLSV